MIRLAALLWMLGASAVWSGAWPRGKGQVFLSGYSYAVPSGTYTGVYGEWGLTDTLTAGLDFGRGVSGQDKAVLFLRGPILAPRSGHHIAWEMGLGQIAGDTVLRPGLSWGKGVMLADRSGWIALDSVAELRLATGAVDMKADLTLGLNISSRRKIMVQVQGGAQFGDDPFLRVVPSLTMQLSKSAQVEVGVTQSLRSDLETGIKLALWLEF